MKRKSYIFKKKTKDNGNEPKKGVNNRKGNGVGKLQGDMSFSYESKT